jgi:hypothetical protein
MYIDGETIKVGNQVICYTGIRNDVWPWICIGHLKNSLNDVPRVIQPVQAMAGVDWQHVGLLGAPAWFEKAEASL